MIRKKRYYYYYRFLKWWLLKDRSPIGASIKITQRCNLNCKHCGWEKKSWDELNFQQWKRIIDDLYHKGVTVIAVEGGEPTLHPDVPYIVDYIKHRGLFCIFITNGTRDLSSINPDVLWISIDGMQECHDRIRGKGTFNKVLETIKANRNKRIISLTSLSKTNINDIEALCKHFSPLLSGLMFNFTYPYSNISEASLNRAEREAAAKHLLALKARYPKLLNSTAYLKEVGKKKTIYPWLLTTVLSNGEQIQGCMVSHIEAYNCSLCDMGCCSELSKVYELKPDAIQFWVNNFGLPRLV